MKVFIAASLISLPFWAGEIPGVDTDKLAVNAIQLVSMLTGATLLLRVLQLKEQRMYAFAHISSYYYHMARIAAMAVSPLYMGRFLVRAGIYRVLSTISVRR
jgi:hypothetical protein